MSDFVGKPVRR